MTPEGEPRPKTLDEFYAGLGSPEEIRQRMAQRVADGFSRLDKRGLRVLNLYFGLFGEEVRKVTEIAQEINRSPRTVRKIVRRTLSQLRENPQ